MPVKPSAYRCAWYLRNGHLQSIWPTLFRRVQSRPVSRIRIDTPDGDFLDLDHYRNSSRKLAVLSHGLEGNSQRHYIVGMAGCFEANGWDVMAWNNRGCSGVPNRKLQFYHSGATYDLDTVVQYALNTGSYDELCLVGFSLGGNQTLKYLGERPDTLDPRIKRAVAFSVPCDLAASARRMALWYNRPYMKRFLDMLHEKIRLKMQMFPGRIDDADYESIRDFEAFDNRYTAPLHGFKDAVDYWTRNSSKAWLPAIWIPTLMVSALDDPFLSRECFPVVEAEANPHLFLETPKHGGHVGFIHWNPGPYWSEERAVAFAEGF